MNLRELVKSQAEKYKDKTFLFWKDTTVSYSQLDALSNKVANFLYDLGIRKGDKVSVYLPNMPEYVYLYLGIPKIGAVTGPVNALFKPREVKFVVGHSEAKAIVTIPNFMELINQIKGELPNLEHIIVIGELVEGTLNYSELMEKASTDNPPEVDIDEKADPAAILYTSGTTGFPKGVLQTHFNIRRNAEMIRDFMDAKEHYRFMLILPLFHVNAQIVTIMGPLVIGASSILTPGFSAQTHWETVANYKASTFSCVPTVLSILLKMPHENLDLSSLEFVICGAAPLPVEVFRAFEDTFKCKVVEGYGLTEGTCASSVNPLPTETEDRRKIGSIGLPLPGNEMKIVDSQGNDLPPNTKGEIVVKGDNVMKEYFKNPEANDETLKDGWLYTGDIGHMDEDGFFYITDRKKDMIIRGGENIYPREIEEVIYSHPSVSLGTVIGVRDKIYGELPKAFIVLKEGESVTEEEVIEYCKKHLADFKVPKYVEFRDKLPQTPTGKIMKQPLREEEEAKTGKIFNG
ncbi:MAG: long-chain-fatty-acid--CoA ligase [Candidatus Lokiarchaeota archaeon]|nr:long-chain-fatty-acid--CoA ligase [Candidatus Lokiarchaeota archaeon]